MSLRVVVTGEARNNISAGANWWAEHRSVDQARRWKGQLRFGWIYPVNHFANKSFCQTHVAGTFKHYRRGSPNRIASSTLTAKPDKRSPVAISPRENSPWT